jgi:hypothetical protein
MKSGAIIEVSAKSGVTTVPDLCFLQVMEEDPIFPCASRPSPPFLAPLRPSVSRLELPWALQDSLASPYLDSSSTLWSEPRSLTSDDQTDVLSDKSTLSLKLVTPTNASPKSPVGPPPAYIEQTPEADYAPDPRDHAKLKTAWEAMLSSRFLATKPLAVLPFYLSSIFVDVQLNPPLRVLLPPNSDTSLDQRQSADSVSSDRVSSHSPEDFCSNLSDRPSLSLMESFASSCTTMHLARNVETVKGCKEAIWEEYEKLYSAGSMPAVTRSSRPKSAAVLSAKPSARETFETEWSVWEKLVQLSFLLYLLT